MEDQDIARVLEYLRARDPEDSARNRYIVGVVGRQILEQVMRIREQRRAIRRARAQPRWFGNENGQNVRKNAKVVQPPAPPQPPPPPQEPRVIVEHLEPLFDIEVEVSLQPGHVSADQMPRDN